ncbi:Spy/CpxP family protein refolding chaperone [Cellvibrio sp. NN19]|uniref:Spy/CpxP family protein refolding chaperone n=1 Tax=Cellvibrio chitinivorans TaxID=3102792 RepID=UPI002B4167F9|nr:Spy/CpxP family protein refolding chaperone [Cellvibrio sp. NN19]
MKSSKLFATGILLVSMGSIAMPSLAGEGRKDCGGDMRAAGWAGKDGFDGRAFRHVGKALELTDAQKETLKAQRETNKTARQALQGKVIDAREALMTAVNSGANDAELSVLAETLGKLQAEQALAAANAQKAFLAVLTEDQKQTLAEIKTKRMERKESRKEARKSVES